MISFNSAITLFIIHYSLFIIHLRTIFPAITLMSLLILSK